MWKNAKEELPEPYRVVLLQLAGDKYTTGWYDPGINDGTGAWLWHMLDLSAVYEIEVGEVRKWCYIRRPCDDADAKR